MNSNSFLYGKGVFTTIAVRDGTPLLWEKHWRRICRNAETVGIDLSGHDARRDEAAVRSLLEAKIAESDRAVGRARLTFYDAEPSAIWPQDGDRESTTGVSIITAEKRQIPVDLALTVSPFPVNSRSPLAGVKSCNYLENILAIDEARRRGFDEAVRLNENGSITGGCMSNIFWEKDGRLFTPSLATGCLAGTTREFIIENLECSEVEVPLAELKLADTIYLTSAGLGVAPVSRFDEKRLGAAKHPILQIFSTAK